LLRQDNALRRLSAIGDRLSVYSDAEKRSIEQRIGAEDRILELARSTAISPAAANPLLEASGSRPITEPARVRELVRRPGVSLVDTLSAAGIDLRAVIADSTDLADFTDWAGIELKYDGYLERERTAAARLAQLDEFALPSGVPYHTLRSLSFEAREKLDRVRPATLGQAGRIPGISPNDLQSLVFEVLKGRGGSQPCFT